MFEAKRFEKILIDNDGAGGNDRVHHVVPDKVDNHIFQPGGEKRTGQTENDRAIFIAQHRFVNLRGAAKIAGRERHFAHRFNQRHDVVLLDVDVLDYFDKKIGFLRFHKRWRKFPTCEPRHYSGYSQFI